MKIFFLASYKGGEKLHWAYQEIFDLLEQFGNRHLDDEIVKMSYGSFVKKMSENKDAAFIHYKNKTKCVDEASLCVFEASVHSLGIGFLIETSLQKNKPTLVFYFEDNVPYFLSGVKHPQLILKKYTKNNIKDVVKEGYDETLHLKEGRFNFYANPKLISFVEEKSKKLGISQSAYIRSLLLDALHKENNTSSSK